MSSAIAMGTAAPGERPSVGDDGSAIGFSAVLRERTRDVHREAERSGFIADLLARRASREGYALFLRNLVPVYDAMEGRLEAADAADPLLRPFADRRLRRAAALRADLAALAGPGWADRLAVLPEAAAYADRIGATSAHRLAAHAYARILGDLSGGQILKPLLARTLALGDTTLRFYDFPALPSLDEPKAAMRDALDRLDPACPDAAELAAEAVTAFRHNIALSVAVSRVEERPAALAAG